MTYIRCLQRQKVGVEDKAEKQWRQFVALLCATLELSFHREDLPRNARARSDTLNSLGHHHKALWSTELLTHIKLPWPPPQGLVVNRIKGVLQSPGRHKKRLFESLGDKLPPPQRPSALSAVTESAALNAASDSGSLLARHLAGCIAQLTGRDNFSQRKIGSCMLLCCTKEALAGSKPGLKHRLS